MSTTLDRPKPDVAKIVGSKFKFHTAAIKAIKVLAKDSSTNKDEYYLEAPASSNVYDRMGDKITLAAQQKMETACKRLTIFLNHNYDVPEDVFGTCEESYLKAATDPEQGDCFDLMVRTRIVNAAENDRAMKTWRLIQDGARLGYSIGGAVLAIEEIHADDPQKDARNNRAGWFGAYDITDIDLYEISVVGIPANQRAIIDDVVRGIKRKLELDVNPDLAGDPAAIAAAKKKLLDQHVTYSAQPGDDRTIAEIAEDEAARKAAEAVAAVKTPETAPTAETPTSEADKPVSEPKACETCGHLLRQEKVGDDMRWTLTPAVGGQTSPCETCTAEVLVRSTKAAPPLDGDNADDMKRAKVVHKAMKHLGKALDHQACAPVEAHMSAASTMLASLLPTGFEGDPSDPDPSTEDPDAKTPTGERAAENITIKVSADTSELEGKLAALKTEAEAVQATLTGQHDEATKLAEEVGKMRSERDELTVKIAALKATPQGRKTAAHRGSYNGQGSYNDPHARRASSSSMKAELSRKLAGED